MTPPTLVVIAICLFICLTTDWVVLAKSVSPPPCLCSDAVREEPQLWVCPQSPWVALGFGRALVLLFPDHTQLLNSTDF